MTCFIGLTFIVFAVSFVNAIGAELSDGEGLLRALRAAETQDAAYQRAVNATRQLIAPLLGRFRLSQDQVLLYILDTARIAPQYRRFAPQTCAAHVVSSTLSVLVCAEKYVQSVEITIRRMEDGNDLLASEKAFVAFARAANTDPTKELARLREIYPAHISPETYTAHIDEHLRETLFFLAAHELGHVLKKNSDGAFGLQQHLDEPWSYQSLEQETSATVVKMCRHASDFISDGFRYGNWADIVAETSDARAVERRFYGEAKEIYRIVSGNFDAERQADGVATDAVIERLRALETTSTVESERIRNLTIENLFALALVDWYQELVRFADGFCGPIVGPGLNTGQQLNLCMGTNRNAYIAAGRLFGDPHPALILRAFQAIRAIIEKRIPEQRRRMSLTREELKSLPPEEAASRYWVAQDLQRYALLGAVMDTPFKFALVGCATGWFKERDKDKGTQLLFMDFYPIEDQVKWIGAAPAATLPDYSTFFKQVLRAVNRHEGVKGIDHQLFEVYANGDIELPKRKVAFSISFSCSFGGKKTDLIEERADCFRHLQSKWIQFLDNQGFHLRLVDDYSLPGWTRAIIAVRRSGRVKFQYLFESETNRSETMGYARIVMLRN